MPSDTIGSSRASPLRHTQLRHAASALARVIEGEAPADVALRELFAQHRNAGSRDRATIAALLYGVLRNYFPLRAALGADASALELCAAQALRALDAKPEALPVMAGVAPAALAQRLAAPAALDDAARHNLPRWMWDALLAQYGATDAAALARSLNAEATVDLRVNSLKATREAAQQALREDGIESEPIDGLAGGLRLRKREALQRTRAFREGLVEPQDAGSQRLALFVEAAPGQTVVDFCAGGGGKALALGALMRNRGELHAFDTSRARLARLEPRLARSGLTLVKAQALRNERDPRLQALAGRCDAVLVDAPCSGSGTLRRNPEVRLREPDLPALTAAQLAILDAAAKLVRPGGRLVYATCSVLAQENQQVVAAFLNSHSDFRRAGELTLLPHKDGTDGFYAARLVRG
jgi:16S rRNA (cytosine967-C5)-methyltransferase